MAMKVIKVTKNFRFPVLLFVMAWAVFCLAVPASAAEAKVTINNKINRNVFVALCWTKWTSDTEGVMWKKGWYKVEPGKSRTLTIQGIRYEDDMGYYAESSPGSGEKKLFWRGNEQNFVLYGDIHPTKSFDTADCSIDGGEAVRFRYINLKKSGGGFAATLNLTN